MLYKGVLYSLLLGNILVIEDRSGPRYPPGNWLRAWLGVTAGRPGHSALPHDSPACISNVSPLLRAMHIEALQPGPEMPIQTTNFLLKLYYVEVILLCLR
jgi:hypothetical protein